MRRSLLPLATFTLGLIVVLLIRPAGAQQPAARPLAEQWEYGQLVNDGGKITWRDESRTVRSDQAGDAVSNLAALVTKLDPNPSAQLSRDEPVMAVYNALGKQGWEYVRVEESRTRQTLFRRKRL